MQNRWTTNAIAGLFGWLLSAALLTCAVGPAAAFQAAGGGQHLWLIQPTEDDAGTLVVHHGRGDANDAVGVARTLPWRVLDRGVAGADDAVWLINEHWAVHRIDARRAGVESQWSYRSRLGPPMPEVESLRAFAVAGSRPWALVQVEPGPALDRIDQQPQQQDDAERRQQMRRNLAMGLPPGTPASRPTGPQQSGADDDDGDDDDDADDDAQGEGDAGADAPGDGEPTAVDASPPTEADAERPDEGGPAVDRLLRVEAGQWQRVPLPADWPASSPAMLLAAPGEPMHLLVRPAGSDAAGLRVYQWDQAARAWTGRDYDVPAARRWTAAIVANQLVAAWQSGDEPLRVQAAVLRRGEAQPVGELTLDQPVHDWSVASRAGRLALAAQVELVASAEAAREADPPWLIATLDLRGEAREPVALRWREPPGIGRAIDYAIMLGVLVMAMLLMFLFWRRDAAANQLALPATLVLSDLGKRSLAAVIDLLPAIAAVMVGYELSPGELLMRWPGQGAAASWQAIEPGVLAVALFVSYTTLAEALTRRTIGKALLGLSVTDLKGGRPRIWQLLVRNLLKSFDLVAWPLLILLVLGPYRQRLGDLVARTVVVTPAPEDEEDQSNESNDE